MTTIRAALESTIPAAAADILRYWTAQREWASVQTRDTLQWNTDRDRYRNFRWLLDYTIESLTRQAAKQAADEIEQQIGKMESKLGFANISSATGDIGGRISMIGERAGRKISIEQQRILKWAPRSGRPFNQFPARIYIDGKFTPEAEYKATFA